MTFSRKIVIFSAISIAIGLFFGIFSVANAKVLYSQLDDSVPLSGNALQVFGSGGTFTDATGHVAEVRISYNDGGNVAGHYIAVGIVDVDSGTTYYGYQPGVSIGCGYTFESQGLNTKQILTFDSSFEWREYPCDGANLTFNPDHHYRLVSFRNSGGVDVQKYYGSSPNAEDYYGYVEDTTPLEDSFKEMTSFSFPGLANGAIDQTTRTVSLHVPFGTDVTALAPTITVSSGATVSPASGVAKDFGDPVTYTVTAVDGSTRKYIVKILLDCNVNCTQTVLYDQPDHSVETIDISAHSFPIITGASGRISKLKFSYHDYNGGLKFFIGAAIVDLTTATNYYTSLNGVCGDAFESKGTEGKVMVELDSSTTYKEYPCTGPNLTLNPSHTYGVGLFRNRGGFGTQKFYGSSPANDDVYLHVEAQSGASTQPCVTDCFSNVLFLPGIKGSVLKAGNDTLWPPATSFSNDIVQLALDDSGNSINDIHTNGILNNFTFLGISTPIYSSFSDFMDSLEGDLINEWMPLAYDWRFSPEKIIQDGVKTETGVKNVIAEIEGLAFRAKNGKVAIVAHSMGGLLGKAIIKELQNQDKDNLIESFTMIGTPQLGTPQAVAALLHGDEEGILGAFITNPKEMRIFARNLQSAHDLLPSEEYFEKVLDPVVKFDPNKSFTENWRNLWGEVVDSFNEQISFLIGVDGRERPNPTVLVRPEVLRSELVINSRNFHRNYDNYEIPDHIRVVQVAGWGLPTTKAVNYTSKHFFQNFGYETLPTSEGDGTVVYPSAVSLSSSETYFFNLDLFRDPNGKMAQHRDILNTSPIQNLAQSIFKQEAINTSNLLSTTKPQVTNLEDKLLVKTNSPVILGAYDQYGNFTGIDPDQDLSAEILEIKEEIPSSAFSYTADGQSIFLPKDGTYDFVFKGTGTGPTTIEVQAFIADIVSPIVVYTDIPTTPTTEANFTVQENAPGDTRIEVDSNNDGTLDLTVLPDGTEPSLTDLLSLLKQRVLSLNTTEKVKQNLLKRIEVLEKKIENKKTQNAKILAKFKNKISKQELKGKINTTDANTILELLSLLEAQSDTTALDSETLIQLKAKIQILTIMPNQKTDLLKRVERLESKQRLVKTLSNLVNNITKKGQKGKISDPDVQELLNILSQIEVVL